MDVETRAPGARKATISIEYLRIQEESKRSIYTANKRKAPPKMGKNINELSGRALASICEATKAIENSRRLRQTFGEMRTRILPLSTRGRVKVLEAQDLKPMEPIEEENALQVAAESTPPGTSEPSLRERQVIELIAAGNSNKQIGSILEISTRTVETYRARVMGKLNVHTTAEIVRYAIRQNISRP
jgi:DNA-binding CsgD family transcriptional regulator